jgi:hypothetical protein
MLTHLFLLASPLESMAQNEDSRVSFVGRFVVHGSESRMRTNKRREYPAEEK